MANLVAPQPLLNLADPPEDGISSVEFSPTSPDVLLATSWDATVRRLSLINVSEPTRQQPIAYCGCGV